MLGKLASLTHVVQALRDNKVRPQVHIHFHSFKDARKNSCTMQIENYAVAELVQGQTRRWVLAWSFADVHLPDVRLPHPPPRRTQSDDAP